MLFSLFLYYLCLLLANNCLPKEDSVLYPNQTNAAYSQLSSCVLSVCMHFFLMPPEKGVCATIT